MGYNKDIKDLMLKINTIENDNKYLKEDLDKIRKKINELHESNLLKESAINEIERKISKIIETQSQDKTEIITSIQNIEKSLIEQVASFKGGLTVMQRIILIIPAIVASAPFFKWLYDYIAGNTTGN
jgi:hypothetical protein|nr:MAG TPA: hypothetical protein [Caudoviricetes sp.]